MAKTKQPKLPKIKIKVNKNPKTKMPKMPRIKSVGTVKVYKRKKKKGNWIAGAIKNPGALRRSAGVKKGQNIPKTMLSAMAKKPGKLGLRARLAMTLKGMKSKGPKA